MSNGWICLHRKILEWEWLSDANTFKLFVICLVLANHEDKRWQGQQVKRGQFVSSVAHLAGIAQMTSQQVRTSLGKLETTGEITKTATNKNSIITICNYDSYQDANKEEQQTRQQTNNKQDNKPLNKQDNKQITINNNNNNKQNNKEKEKSIKKEDFRLDASLLEEDRLKAFVNEIQPYVNDYGKDLCNDFYRYWTVKDKKGKMRFEKEEMFVTKLRLATWYKKSTGKERKLPPQVEAQLPNIDNFMLSSQSDDVTLDKNLVKMLQAQYTIEGDDGKMYASFNDYKNHTNSLDDRLAREIERKKEMIQQEQIQ